ncbi:hypothetical protein BDF20DRAFT_833256 [Mycotypha africana]|uniref:uncharacterized protein n=1 Tax=Mycotypha africana TaxID=64632 RepID=UPI002301C5F0|nr:uncharacterized protein BDF20DRAFT_833256 [Mycotypha africana]KAI8988394.1 hypothetical protein BDF20DRAFT_833256 [Mycotypha africana]
MKKKSNENINNGIHPHIRQLTGQGATLIVNHDGALHTILGQRKGLQFHRKVKQMLAVSTYIAMKVHLRHLVFNIDSLLNAVQDQLSRNFLFSELFDGLLSLLSLTPLINYCLRAIETVMCLKVYIIDANFFHQILTFIAHHFTYFLPYYYFTPSPFLFSNFCMSSHSVLYLKYRSGKTRIQMRVSLIRICRNECIRGIPSYLGNNWAVYMKPTTLFTVLNHDEFFKVIICDICQVLCPYANEGPKNTYHDEAAYPNSSVYIFSTKRNCVYLKKVPYS